MPRLRLPAQQHLQAVRAPELRRGEAIDDLLTAVGRHDDAGRQDRMVGGVHHRRLVEGQVEDRGVHVVEVAFERERDLLAHRNLGAGAGLVRAQEAVLERHQVEARQRENEARRLVVDAGARLQPDGAVVASRLELGQVSLEQAIAERQAGIDRGLGRRRVRVDVARARRAAPAPSGVGRQIVSRYDDAT